MTNLASLLAENDWLRSLAFRLAGPEAADDALQQAWVAYRTRVDSIRNPGAWFARVIANFAARRSRDETRRSKHEQGYAATRETSALPADELVARMEQQRRVAEAVLALDEPYRSTVLAHFMDGLSTKAIAARTGEPWATVRSRLSRGLQLLRDDLERDGSDWRDKLAFVVFGVKSARLGKGPAAVAPSVMAMVALLVIGVVLPVVWFGVVDDPSPGTVPVTMASTDRTHRESPPGGDRHAAGELVVAATPPASPAPDVTYAGELLDPQGKPMPVVGLLLAGKRVGETDGNGRFQLTLPAGEHELMADDEHWILCASPLRVDQPNRFLATRRIRIYGKVIDADGHAVPHARLSYHESTPVDYPHSLGGLSFRQTPLQHATDTGCFDVSLPWLEGTSIGAHADGYREAKSLTFAATDGTVFSMVGAGTPRRVTTPDGIRSYRPSVEAQFVVHRREPTRDPEWLTWVIEGVVIDSTRRPVAGAQVAFPHCTTVRTGADGTFRIENEVSNLLDGGHLIAWHPEFGACAIETPHDRWRDLVTKNPHETLQLQRSDRSIRGRVVGADCRPLAGRRVRAADPLLALDTNHAAQEIEANSVRVGASTDAHGDFELAGLLPRDYRLWVLDPQTLQQFETKAFAAGTQDALVTVPAPDLLPEWNGRIVDARGDGIPGASVTTSLWGPWGALGSTVLVAVKVEADEKGRVTLPAQCGGGVTVTAEAPDRMIYARVRGHLPAEIRLGRIVRFRYQADHPPASNNQRRLEVLDANDTPLIVSGPYMGQMQRGYVHYLTGARSAVLETSELATTLVINTDDGMQKRNEPHRHPIHLVPGEITVVK